MFAGKNCRPILARMPWIGDPIVSMNQPLT